MLLYSASMRTGEGKGNDETGNSANGARIVSHEVQGKTTPTFQIELRER